MEFYGPANLSVYHCPSASSEWISWNVQRNKSQSTRMLPAREESRSSSRTTEWLGRHPKSWFQLSWRGIELFFAPLSSLPLTLSLTIIPFHPCFWWLPISWEEIYFFSVIKYIFREYLTQLYLHYKGLIWNVRGNWNISFERNMKNHGCLFW